MTHGALVITFPRARDTARRLEFMAAVAQGIPAARWASRVAEPGRTVELEVSDDERRVMLARLTARRARGVDGPPVSMLELTE